MTDWRPPFAYIPGRTGRHPEDLFDALKAGIDPADLAASLAWRAGLAFFREGFFWEAHEVWEAVWMAAPENSAEQRLVQALIQAANAGLKRRMGQTRAAERLDAMADGLLADAFGGDSPRILGLERREALALVHRRE